jgi:hypothetical protein
VQDAVDDANEGDPDRRGKLHAGKTKKLGSFEKIALGLKA